MEPSPLKIFLYKTKRKCLRFFSWIPYKGLKKYDLIIYDDIYPHPISGFRLEEFTVLLEEFPNSKIIVKPLAYPHLKTPIYQHKTDIEALTAVKNSLSGKIKSIGRFTNINTKLFYCIFLNNIWANLNWLEKFKIPFSFTLYPGGGFMINDQEIDEKMRKVFSSPQFKNVFVTQKFTRDYLISKNLCSEDKIQFIFGCVVPQISMNKDLSAKKNFRVNKETLDICFCAAKYTATGEDKGYDIFIGMAQKLSESYDFVRFHVVGGFSKEDIDVLKLGTKIKFYGYQKFEKLSEIYSEMDFIVSANRPFVLNKGEFDGFPLGTVVEAALNGVAVLVSDALNQNTMFDDNEDVIIVENNVESVSCAIENLIHNPHKIKDLGLKGKEKFLKVYSNEIQLEPRIATLKKYLKNA